MILRDTTNTRAVPIEVVREHPKSRRIQTVQQGTNAKLIATAQKLYPMAGAVCDLTYGKGAFWSAFRPDDLSYINPIHNPDFDFRDTWWSDDTFDHVVFDPPYVAPGGRNTSKLADFNARYGMHHTERTPNAQWLVIGEGLREAARIVKPKGLVWFKCMDYVSSGRVHWFTKEALNLLASRGLELEDEFILAGRPGPQPSKNPDGSDRRQVHAARSHSSLMIARKR